GDPMLRLLWVIGSLFAVFFALSVMTDYVAATGVGLVVVLTLSLWDQVISPELKVENTLWALGQTTLACLVTLRVEFAFAAWKRWNAVIAAIAERLSAVVDFLGSAAEGLPASDVQQRLARLAMVGTSSVRLSVHRSPYSTWQMEHMRAVVALVGRIVDIAADMATAGIAPSSADRARVHAVAERIARIRSALLLERVPQDAEEPGTRTASDGVPFLRELERSVSLLAEVFSADEVDELSALPPARDQEDWRWLRPDALSNPDHVKFALKGCLAAGLCYVLYTAVKWPGISTAVVTCLFTALTSIGASRQKQALRIGGAIAGGIVAVGA